TRYRLAVVRKTRADTAEAISRLADSSEDAVRNLVALPLRMLIGTLDFVEAQLHKASDTLREIDPLDERVVQLERRVDSLEHQTTGRRQSSRTTTAAQRCSASARSIACARAQRPRQRPAGSDSKPSGWPGSGDANRSTNLSSPALGGSRIRSATSAVQPVWWVAPRPAPLSPWK